MDYVKKITGSELLKFNLEHKDKMIRFMASRGVGCNLDNPKTIQEKLAWLNIYDVDIRKSMCADKLYLKKYVKEKIGEDISVKTLNVFDTYTDVKLSELPEKFVIKCNHGFNMNIISTLQNKLTQTDLHLKLKKWLNTDFAFSAGFESHYHWIERKCFSEEFLNDGNGSIIDYKFICFNGEPTFCQVITDRNGANKCLNYYDMNFKFLPFSRVDFQSNEKFIIERPKCFEMMKEYAKTLSSDFKFVRVDFYEVHGKVYIGEMTFSPAAFSFSYKNKDDEITIGNMLDIYENKSEQSQDVKDDKIQPSIIVNAKEANKQKRVIVSMTSWPPRIGNVPTTLDSLLSQTRKPDLIEINLSTVEFPNKEGDLPKTLTKMLNENDCIEINWVDKNTGVFKKFIPTLKKFYNEDYYLLSVDDDRRYRKDYIEMMVNEIKTRKCDSFSLSNAYVLGNRMIYESKAFEPDFWEKLTDEIIKNRISDKYIEHYLTQRGKKKCKFQPNDIRKIVVAFNEVSPNSHGKTGGLDAVYSSADIRKAYYAINKISFVKKK